MYLVQLLLPLTASTDSKSGFESVLGELTDKFGGATAFLASPAEGLWESGDGVERDRVVTVEVMVEVLDAAWWEAYRRTLEDRFSQDEIIVRAHAIQRF